MDHTHVILIVDDDPATCALYQRVLGETYRVIVCSESASARDALRSQLVSAVIIEPDVMYGQGWNLLEDMRATASMRDVPIVVCSASEAHRRDLGGGAFFLKPFLPSLLLATLQQIV